MSFVGDIFGGGSSSPPPPQVIQTSGGSKPTIPKQLAPYYTGAPKKFKPGADEGILYQASQQFQDPREYFSGSTVVPFSGLTQQGMGQIEGMAQQPNQLAQGAQGGLLDIFNNQGFMSPISDIASGENAIDTSRLENIAGGGLLGQNPHIDQLISQISGDATQAVNDNAFFGGREGSPYHAGAVAEGVGRATAPVRYGDYQQERGYMQDAIGQLAGVEGTNIANQFGAAQGGIGAQLSAGQAAPGADEFGYSNANRLMGLGGMQEGKSAQELQEQLSRFQFDQNERSNALAQYAALVGGSPIYQNQGQGQVFGPQQQTGFSGGGALGGAYMGGQIGSMFGPVGALPGAALGGLLGGFG